VVGNDWAVLWYWLGCALVMVGVCFGTGWGVLWHRLAPVMKRKGIGQTFFFNEKI